MPPRKNPPSFDFFPDDFLGGTYYMHATAVGMYVRSICFQWSSNCLPNDRHKLAAICGVSLEDFDAHWPQVAEKFISDGNGSLINERLKAEKEKKLRLSEVRSEAGKKGGQAIAKQLPKQTPSKGKKEVGSRKKEGSSTRKKEYSTDFERFWSVFPAERKRSKADAYRAWKLHVTGDIVEVVIAAAAEYSESDEGRCKYVAGPAPWLNQERWEDDRRAWDRTVKDMPEAEVQERAGEMKRKKFKHRRLIEQQQRNAEFEKSRRKTSQLGLGLAASITERDDEDESV